jgi:FkbM family methyltransferase
MLSLPIGKYVIDSSNLSELRGLKTEIFTRNIYEINLTSPAPLIIDAGAHVGLATLFFKTRYPHSRIIAVEPHPENVRHLDHNIWFNKLTNLTVVEAALGSHPGETDLYFDNSGDHWFSAAGFTRGAWDHSQTSAAVRVPVIPLDALIAEPVDLLKMDIEGAEVDVLRASKKLHLINNLIIELHPPHIPTDLEKIFKPTHHLETRPHHHGLKLVYISKT